MDANQNPEYVAVPPSAPAAAPAATGLSDNAAAAIAYITIIPAIIFLVIEPYNKKPFVKYNCFQCIALSVIWFALHFIVVIPILGIILALLGDLCLFVVWILCIVKASQGTLFKLPVLSGFIDNLMKS